MATKRERLYPVIKRLREDEGLKWREIGERLGISLKTAWDYYDDPDNSKHMIRHRRWQATDYSECPGCGGRMGHERKGHERCADCHRKREQMATDAKLHDVAEMYREGLSQREIAAMLGYGAHSSPPEINEAFRRGILRADERRYDLARVEAARAARWGK